MKKEGLWQGGTEAALYPDPGKLPVNDRLDTPLLVREDVPEVEIAVEQAGAELVRVAEALNPRRLADGEDGNDTLEGR
jgi:hypothetical protein